MCIFLTNYAGIGSLTTAEFLLHTVLKRPDYYVCGSFGTLTSSRLRIVSNTLLSD